MNGPFIASQRHAYHAYFVVTHNYSSSRAFLLVDLMREHAYRVHAAVKNCLKGSIKQELEAANGYEKIAFMVAKSDFWQATDIVAAMDLNRKKKCLSRLIALRQIRLNKAVWGVRLP